MADQTVAVHAAITLTAAAQVITTGITNPAVARCISITGTKAGATLTGNVTLTGTDTYGDAAAVTIALNGNETVFDVTMALATVTQIDLPIRTTALDTVKVGLVDRLFDIPTARAFNGAKLASTDDYPSAAINAKETEIRQWLESEAVCNVAFLPTKTVEYQDGDGSGWLMLDHRLPLLITAATVDGTALSAAEILATDYDVGLAVHRTGKIVRRSGFWDAGQRNVKLTYWHGHAACPDLVRRAALAVLVTELPATNVSLSAESYDEGGMSVSYAAGDGFNGAWHRIADVRKAIRAYGRATPGVG